MKSLGHRTIIICLLLIYWVPAHAYLDPGTGSAIIQGLIATVAALGATFRVYRFRIQAFFASRKSGETPPEEIESEEA